MITVLDLTDSTLGQVTYNSFGLNDPPHITQTYNNNLSSHYAQYLIYSQSVHLTVVPDYIVNLIKHRYSN